MGPMSLTESTDGEILAILGLRLRKLREARQFSSGEAAKAAGLSRRTVYRAERGLNPTTLTLIRLLRLYGSLDALAAFIPEAEISPMALIRRPARKRTGDG